MDRCWELHPELKPKFPRDSKGGYPTSKGGYKPSGYNANTVSNYSANGFTSSPIDLINEFASYIYAKQGTKQNTNIAEENKDSSALIGQFAGFLAANKSVPAEDTQGILNAFSSALIISNVHDLWIIDSGATDHITNKQDPLLDFQKFLPPAQISVANGKNAPVLGEGKIKLLSQTIVSPVLYLSIRQLASRNQACMPKTGRNSDRFFA